MSGDDYNGNFNSAQSSMTENYKSKNKVKFVFVDKYPSETSDTVNRNEHACGFVDRDTRAKRWANTRP